MLLFSASKRPNIPPKPPKRPANHGTSSTSASGRMASTASLAAVAFCRPSAASWWVKRLWRTGLEKDTWPDRLLEAPILARSKHLQAVLPCPRPRRSSAWLRNACACDPTCSPSPLNLSPLRSPRCQHREVALATPGALNGRLGGLGP